MTGVLSQGSLDSRAPSIDAHLAEHQDVLLGVARRLTSTDSQAKDLVQDTFLRALEKQSSFRPGTLLRAWLVAILNHRFIDLCRRERARGKHQSIDALELEATPPEPPPIWAQIDADTLRALAQKLPDDVREVYRLHAFEELSYAQIARKLSIPQNTVGTRLHRARKQLRALAGGIR